jgi:hypothetical protein
MKKLSRAQARLMEDLKAGWTIRAEHGSNGTRYYLYGPNGETFGRYVSTTVWALEKLGVLIPVPGFVVGRGGVAYIAAPEEPAADPVDAAPVMVPVVILNTGDARVSIHAPGCAHLNGKRDAAIRSGGSCELAHYATRRAIVEDVYGGHEELEENPEGWADYAARAGLTFAPCCPLK